MFIIVYREKLILNFSINFYSVDIYIFKKCELDQKTENYDFLMSSLPVSHFQKMGVCTLTEV